jgi:ribulose-5-phosphate 4-epimerase/fuculose-1-phosphate aldolase
MHAHTPAGAAVSTLKAKFLPISQEAMIRQFFLGYHEYEGVLLDEKFKEAISKDLGDLSRIMLLHNHGNSSICFFYALL